MPEGKNNYVQTLQLLLRHSPTINMQSHCHSNNFLISINWAQTWTRDEESTETLQELHHRVYAEDTLICLCFDFGEYLSA